MSDQSDAMNFEGYLGDNYNSNSVEEAEETEEVEEVTEAKEEGKAEVEQAEEVEEEDTSKPKDKNIQALDSERARRKKAEAELKELRAKLESDKQEKENAERVEKEQSNLKQKLMADGLIDEEVADRLMSTFGNQLVSNTIAETQRKENESFESQLTGLMKNETFYDADKYRDGIRNLMNKGLTMEQAYFASVGASGIQNLRKEAEIEAEQRFLNNNQRADNIDVGTAQSKGDVAKRAKYTSKEQRIANESNLSLSDVRKRLGATTLDEFLNL